VTHETLRLRAGSRRLSGSEFEVDGPTTATHWQSQLSSRYRKDNKHNNPTLKFSVTGL